METLKELREKNILLKKQRDTIGLLPEEIEYFNNKLKKNNNLIKEHYYEYLHYKNKDFNNKLKIINLYYTLVSIFLFVIILLTLKYD